MKKLLMVAIVVILVAAVITVLLIQNARSRSPEVLLKKLAAGQGNKEELIMRLNVARGDVVGPMIEAVQNEKASPQFRAEVLELLFKKNFNSSEPRIEEVLIQAASNPDVIIRRKAAEGMAVYAESSLQLELIDHICDPDPEVRRQVYLVLGADIRGSSPRTGGIWSSISEQHRGTVVERCLEQMDKEDNPEMRQLVRAVIGKEIEIRGEEATQALQTSDIQRAEEILRGALELDPQNRQAQIRLVRFYLETGSRQAALEIAKKYDELIEIPQLSEVPIIDGDPSDHVWAEGYSTDKFYHTTSRWVGKLTEGKSKAIIGHRDGSIYIAVIGYEKDLTKLVTNQKGRDSQVYLDDCVELIFDPDITGGRSYQFVINSAGVLFDNVNGNASKNFKCQYGAKVFRDRGYWACEFAINGKDLDNHPIAPGKLWSLNVFRVRIGPASEHGVIKPLYGRAHRMNLYPLAVFR